MALNDRAVAWLRALDAARVAADDIAATAVALGLLAVHTPAWREPYAAALATLAVRADAADAADTDVATAARPDAGSRARMGRLVRAIRARVAGAPAGDAADAACADDLATLAAAHPGGAAAAEAWAVAADAGGPEAWAALVAAPLAPCPQVVGVEVPQVVLRRAEWWRDSLYLGVAPAVADPAARTELRLVGAEPRMWYVTGIDDVMVDVSAHGMAVRFPRVAGEIVFTPGSY